MSNYESYSTIDKWMGLITRISQKSIDMCGDLDEASKKDATHPTTARVTGYRLSSSTSVAPNLTSNNDPFMEFVCLVASYLRCAPEKESRKFLSNVCMKLKNDKTKDFTELGIIRVCSLFISMSTVVQYEREALSMVRNIFTGFIRTFFIFLCAYFLLNITFNFIAYLQCGRLQGFFNYSQVKSTPARRKAVLRAYSCLILVLLKKKISLLNQSFVSFVMKTIDSILSQVAVESTKKELVMVYMDLLDNLPKHTPDLCSRTDLGRHVLISPNLSMWFSNAGSNYVLRTAQCLNQITDWIIKWTDDTIVLDLTATSEGKELYGKINEKSISFIKSAAILNSNRIPSTDMEPLACLAADLTLLSRKFQRNSTEFTENVDLFANHERTCPVFSQYFIQRLFKSQELIENTFPFAKWTQTWIRLVALDCSVPDELTSMVLTNNFKSTSNQELLQVFCKKLDSDNRSQKEVQDCMSPLVQLLEGVTSGKLFKDDPQQRDSLNVITSVISSCAVVFKNIKFEKLYVRGTRSVAHLLLNLMVPPPWPGIPPWEKFSPTVLRTLEENLFYIFQAVALYSGVRGDSFLNRKLQEIVIFAFFGFIKKHEDVNRKKHPAFVRKFMQVN